MSDRVRRFLPDMRVFYAPSAPSALFLRMPFSSVFAAGKKAFPMANGAVSFALPFGGALQNRSFPLGPACGKGMFPRGAAGSFCFGGFSVPFAAFRPSRQDKGSSSFRRFFTRLRGLPAGRRDPLPALFPLLFRMLSCAHADARGPFRQRLPRRSACAESRSSCARAFSPPRAAPPALKAGSGPASFLPPFWRAGLRAFPPA